MRWSLLDICHVVGAVNLYKYWPLVSRRLAVNVTQVKRITSVCLMMFRLVAYVLEYKFAQETNRANGRRVIHLTPFTLPTYCRVCEIYQLCERSL